jgi:hypothetical protein
MDPREAAVPSVHTVRPGTAWALYECRRGHLYSGDFDLRTFAGGTCLRCRELGDDVGADAPLVVVTASETDAAPLRDFIDQLRPQEDGPGRILPFPADRVRPASHRPRGGPARTDSPAAG